MMNEWIFLCLHINILDVKLMNEWTDPQVSHNLLFGWQLATHKTTSKMADKSRNTEYRWILKVTRFATVLNYLVNGQTFSLKGKNFAMSTQEKARGSAR